MSGKDTLSQAEIDALLAAVAADPKDADSDAGGGRAKRIQNMDFRRPSKFNKDQLHTLEMLHDTFSRLGGTYLSSALRCMTDITVLGAEQVTYGEFIASLPVPALTAIVELEPLGTNAICAFDLPLVFSMIDRLLGGAGAATYRLRELTDIELSLSRTVVTRLLDELSTSWNELVGVDFTLRQTEMNPQFAQIAPPTELSVLLSFQIRIHESSGVMALCLPYRSIESVAPSLTTQSYFSGQRSVDPSFSLAGGLEGVDIELRAEVGAIDLRIEDVLALRPGDIVPLGIPVEEGVRLMAGQHEVYRAFPGAYQRHLAVQVTERTGVAIGTARGIASAPAPLPEPEPLAEELAGMTEHEAVERAIGLIAEASARTLAALSGTEATVEGLSVVPAEGAQIDVPRPVVSARVPFTSILQGDNYFLLQPDQAANLAKAMMGDAYPGDGGELTEIELSAIAEAMNQMMGGACSALADELSIEADIAPPEVKVLDDGGDVAEIADAVYVARFRLVSPVLEADLVQLISQDFAGRLHATLSSAEQARNIVGDAAPSVGAAGGGDPTFTAVERTARITAESAAEVLTTLVGDTASATIPTIEVDPDDPLGALDYPLIAVEVAYVSGVTGNNLFVLSPEQASKLAALMMGMPEPMGDGLSDMELSAVSEAMNQMMGAATNVMADTLTMAIEVAPPTCTVIQSADEARGAFSDCAFSARFKLISSAFDADVVQLVSAEFASHLREAFESSEAASAVVAEAPLAPAPMPSAAPTGWADVAAPSAYDDRRVRDVRVRFSAELGRTRLPVSRVANLPAGAVVKLDRSPADAVDVLINGLPFAQARLVLVDGEYAVQIVSLTPQEIAA